MYTTLREIVLIDDDKDVNELNKRFINTTEIFEIIHAFDRPRQALEFTHVRLKTNKDVPALFMVDIAMPEIDGFELIDELNELFDKYYISIRPKFVIVSGSIHSLDVEKIQRSQNTLDYITKPLGWNQMQNILSQMTT
jgi:response regulator of citrate/malate metabolism